MSLSLYRKWRPQQWEQIIGQDHIVQTLRNAVSSDRLTHAYLFAGPRGTGKTTTARLLAKAANCLDEDLAARPCDQCEYCIAIRQGRFLDLIEIDAASNTSVEDVRNLRDKINFSPNQGRFKVYIIDEVHMLSTAAFNALLKTLEEPPAHALFVLATTEVHKIPATVLSRCQRHEFRRIPAVQLVSHLRNIVANERLQAEENALVFIARQATGSVRDAISLLDQLSSSGKAITLELAESILGSATSQSVLNVVDALIDGKAAEGLNYIHHALDGGCDPRLFARQIVDHLRNLLLARMGNADQLEVTAELSSQIARQVKFFSLPTLLQDIQYFNRAVNETRSAWQPSLPLEIAFLEALQESTPVEESPPRAAGTTSHNPGDAHDTPANQDYPIPTPKSKVASPVVAPALESGVELSTDQLSKCWQEAIKLIGQTNPRLKSLLQTCHPYGVRNGILFLGFETQILKGKMERKEYLELIEENLRQVVGKPVTVRCFVLGQRRPLPEGVDSDGMLAAALRDLGGEIVDIQ